MKETPPTESRQQIPPERKAMYYGGMALTGLGFLLFLSTFFTFAANFGNFDNFVGRAQTQMCTAISGMVMIVGGGILSGIGRMGWAGSGVVLDPEQARKDVEPWARMGGGVTQDALSEIEVVKKLEKHLDAPAAQQVKVRCRHCQALNDEDAKFCNKCGTAL